MIAKEGFVKLEGREMGGIIQEANDAFFDGDFQQAKKLYSSQPDNMCMRYYATLSQLALSPLASFDDIDNFVTLTDSYLNMIAVSHGQGISVSAMQSVDIIGENNAVFDDSAKEQIFDMLLHTGLVIHEMNRAICALYERKRIGGEILFACVRTLWNVCNHIVSYGRTVVEYEFMGASERAEADSVFDSFMQVAYNIFIFLNNLVALGEFRPDDNQRQWIEQAVERCPLVKGYAIYTVLPEEIAKIDDEDERETVGEFGNDFSLVLINAWDKGMSYGIDEIAQKYMSLLTSSFDETVNWLINNPFYHIDSKGKIEQELSQLLDELSDRDVSYDLSSCMLDHVTEQLGQLYRTTDAKLHGYYVSGDKVNSLSMAVDVSSIYHELAIGLWSASAMLESYVHLFPFLRNRIVALIESVDDACVKTCTKYKDPTDELYIVNNDTFIELCSMVARAKQELARLGNVRDFAFDELER